MTNQGLAEQTGLVLDIDRFSTHDGPGIRMVVFTKGCPLGCHWCHSPESQSNTQELLYQQARCRVCALCVSTGPQGAISPRADGMGIDIDRGKCVRCFECTKKCYTSALRIAGSRRTVAEIVEIAHRDQAFYEASGGGVTVSGGEPLMQGAFVLALMQGLEAIGVHTMLETSGYGAEDTLLSIACHTSQIYYDIKLLDDAKHREFTGVSNALILSNLRALAADASLRGRICVRTPCIPGVNDAPEHIKAIAQWVHSLGISHMEVLPYNGMSDAKYEWVNVAYPLGTVVEQDPAHFQILKQIVEDEGLTAF